MIKELIKIANELDRRKLLKEADCLDFLLKNSALINNLSEEIDEDRAKEMEALEQTYFSSFYAQDSDDILDDMQQPGSAGVVYVDDDSEKVGGYLYGYQLVFEDEFGGANIDIEDFECFDEDCYDDIASFAQDIVNKAKDGEIFYVSNFLLAKAHRMRINDLIFGFLEEVRASRYEYIAFDALSDTYNLIMKNDSPNSSRELKFGIKVIGKINKATDMFLAKV